MTENFSTQFNLPSYELLLESRHIPGIYIQK